MKGFAEEPALWSPPFRLDCQNVEWNPGGFLFAQGGGHGSPVGKDANVAADSREPPTVEGTALQMRLLPLLYWFSDRLQASASMSACASLIIPCVQTYLPEDLAYEIQ